MLAIFVLAACGETTEETTGNNSQSSNPETITIDEFADIIENRADEYLILNVHIPFAGEVANTDGHVAFNDLDALTNAIPDKNTPVILYCRSGNMSDTASHQLRELGYTHIIDVPGGMNAWQASGRVLN